MARGNVVVISPELMAQVEAEARGSTRRRKNFNFHTSDADNPHRFLNVLVKGSYVQPHRHRDPGKAESFVILSGRVAVFLFDDRGAVTGCYVIGENPSMGVGIDLLPGVWHCVTALTEVAACFEVKPGPWDPATDKEFAPWAPAEGDPESAAYLANLVGKTRETGMLE